MAKQVWDDPRITAYVLGELNGNERVAFERLLDQDAELQQAVNEAERVKREVGSFLQASPVPSLSASQKARVEQAIEGNYNPVAKSSQPVTPAGSPATTERRWSGMLSLAVSAVIVAGIGAAVLLVGPGRDLVAFRAESDAALNVSSEAPQTATRAQTSQSTDSQADKKTADVAAAASELSFSPEANAAPKDQSAVDSLGVPPIAVPGEPPMAKVAADAAPTTSLADAPTAPAAGGEFQRGSGAPNSRARPFELPQDPSPAALVPPAPMSAAIPSPAPLPPGAPGPAPSTAAAPIAGGARGLGSEASGMLPAGGPVNGPDRVAVGRDGFSGGALGGGGLGTLPADGLEEGEAKPGLPMTAESRLNADEDFTKATPSRGGLRAEGKLAEPQQEAARTKLLQKKETDQGTGPGSAGDRFQLITDNPFVRVNEAPLSTFSVDVDTASYSKVRQYLLEAHTKPRPDAVRIEELVNYFDYEYKAPEPKDPHPFAVHVQVAPCPWNNEHQLARIAIKGRELEGERPRSNLVFLVDTSGSMNEPNKLPLVVRGLRMLVSQLNERDRVAIVVYAGSAGLVLDSTPGDRRDKLLDALDRLAAGGSTDGGSGIRLAYDVARENFIEGGTNRVILCTDGDFNVGTTGTDELVRLVEEQAKAKIFLTTLGFGMGNHNDAMLEQISDRGNGNYGFIDTAAEARKLLVKQVSSTLVTIAKDVKLQIEFNPAKIAGYRLIGYENRVLAAQDFNDDKKDAGEIGAGHEVTAFYELVPAGKDVTEAAPPVDDLRYQAKSQPKDEAIAQELFVVKLRYKQPEGDTSTLLEAPAQAVVAEFADTDDDFRFAAAVASFGMQLRDSPYKGTWKWDDIRKAATAAQGPDRGGLRGEFLELLLAAEQLSK